MHVEPDRLAQISLRHGGDGARDFGRRAQQVFDQRVDGRFHFAPRAPRLMKARAFARPSFFTHHLPNALQLQRDVLVRRNNFIEGIGNLPRQSRPRSRQPH